MDKKFKTFFVLFKEELEPRLKNKIYVPKVYSKYTTRKVYCSAVLWILAKFRSRTLYLEIWEMFKIPLNDILNNFARLLFSYCWCQTSWIRILLFLFQLTGFGSRALGQTNTERRPDGKLLSKIVLKQEQDESDYKSKSNDK